MLDQTKGSRWMTRQLEVDNELVNDSMHVENWTITVELINASDGRPDN